MAQSEKYLPELMAEKDSIDPSFVHAVRLIKQEIENINNPKESLMDAPKVPKKDLLDVSGRTQKVECDIMVPADRFPSINFVGRLIGPGGSTMKGIQELTNTKMAVLGRGSVREKDRKKAEELKDKDEKYAHLNYPLHVHISALGPVPQAFVNLGRAAAEIQKLIMVDESEGQGFMGGGMQGMHGGRGGMGSGMRGRGGPGRGFQRGGRGGMQRGGSGGRGAGQGARGSSRGGTRGRGAGRGQAASQYNAMSQSADSFGDDFSYDGYGASAAAAASTGFETGYEGYEESYDASYDTGYGAEAGYGDGGYSESYGGFGQESYDAFGNGSAASAKSAGGYGGQGGGFRGKMRGNSRGRQKPY